MASQQQIDANRRNARKSTGPKTPQGKARSAQNARKHAFTASTFAVVRLEDLHEIEHLRADLIAVYQPVNSQELFAIERMALAQQAILRAARLESGLFTTCLNEVLDYEGDSMILMNPVLSGDGDIEVTRAQNRNWLLGEGFRRCVDKSNSWSLLIRYQAQAERHYRRAVEEFERLKALRQELPNEPNFDPQPEQKEPLPPPENEPVSAGDPALGSQGGGPPERPAAQAQVSPILQSCAVAELSPTRRSAAAKQLPFLVGALLCGGANSDPSRRLDVQWSGRVGYLAARGFGYNIRGTLKRTQAVWNPKP